MLCDLPTVQQAAVGDCLSFDPFPFYQNGLPPPEVDVGRRQVGDALVISWVIGVGGAIAESWWPKGPRCSGFSLTTSILPADPTVDHIKPRVVTNTCEDALKVGIDWSVACR